MLEVLESGAIKIAETETGEYRQVLPTGQDDSGIMLNYCPFCGSWLGTGDEPDEDADVSEGPQGA